MNAPAVVPAIGGACEGGVYAGLSIHDGAPVHLVLLPDQFNGKWKPALAWAKKLDAELPTRMDLLAMWNNIRGEFEKDWYWSGEEHHEFAGHAWYQSFRNGSQYGHDEDTPCRARAVRRLPIQHFSNLPSVAA